VTDDGYVDEGVVDDDDYYDDDDYGEDDEFLAARRGRSRRRNAIVAGVVAVLLIGTVVFRFQAEKSAAAEAERIEALLLRAEPGGVAEAITASSALVAADRGRNAAFLGLELRANLLYYSLYSGSSRLRRKATERLEDARLRAPDSTEFVLAEALWNALVGSPAQATLLLDSGSAGTEQQVWQALARSEAARRMGASDRSAETLVNTTEPLALAWRLRDAWVAGRIDAARGLADELLALCPEHPMATTVTTLVSSRGQASEEQAGELLAPLLEAAQSMPNRLTAWVVVEQARLVMRNSRSGEARGRAQELLDAAREADDPAPELIQEAAWLRMVNGSFGAARTLANKGLRELPDDPSLIALVAIAEMFNDSSAQIVDLLRSLPEESNDSAGAIQAQALAALVRGDAEEAVQGLSDTVHLGVPGQSRLFLAEALIQAGRAKEALEQARAGRQSLTEVYGAESRDAALGAAYEGLALAALGDHKAAAAEYETALSGQNKTPWIAWLYGRSLQYAEETAVAKDALLIACHTGQDFARACWDLAEIYDLLRLDALQRRTQSEAKRKYLTTSPKGWHVEQVRSAL